MSRAAAVASRPPRARSTDEKVSPWNDVHGILLLMLSAMLLLALVSYDPRDMPGWSFLALSESSGEVTQNFVGRTGALVAGHLLWLMGLAGYLLPFSMTWFGVSKLHSKMKITRVAWLGVVVMIVTAAGLLEVQNLLNERDHITPLGGGGALGYFVGGSILKTLFGKIGATLLLTVVYVVGLFLTTGQHPLTAIRSIRAELSRWQQEREAQRLIEEKLAEEAANTIPGTLTPVPTELRRKKKGGANCVATLPWPPPWNCRSSLTRRTPKIIDSSIPRSHDDNADKPKLAEVWEKKRAQKIEQAPHGSLGNLTVRFKDYKLPPMDLLQAGRRTEPRADRQRRAARHSGHDRQGARQLWHQRGTGRHHPWPGHHALRGAPRRWPAREPHRQVSTPTSPAPRVPSASTSSPRFPAKTPWASNSRTRRRSSCRCVSCWRMKPSSMARPSCPSLSARTCMARRSSAISPPCRICSSRVRRVPESRCASTASSPACCAVSRRMSCASS
jgi:DNA segregation ATPase FtsK/SpoIIIE-like protein